MIIDNVFLHKFMKFLISIFKLISLQLFWIDKIGIYQYLIFLIYVFEIDMAKGKNAKRKIKNAYTIVCLISILVCLFIFGQKGRVLLLYSYYFENILTIALLLINEIQIFFLLCTKLTKSFNLIIYCSMTIVSIFREGYSYQVSEIYFV